MSILAIRNIGTLVSGDLETGILDANTILCNGGVISHIGKGLDVSKADVVVDAQGTTVIPGLIDSHCHVVLGDYTPRQRTVGFLESYTHGGITSVISPGEIHAPGRPKDAAGVKGLAVAARACFLNFRPNGMKVHAGRSLSSRHSQRKTSKKWRSKAYGWRSSASATSKIPMTASPKFVGRRSMESK